MPVFGGFSFLSEMDYFCLFMGTSVAILSTHLANHPPTYPPVHPSVCPSIHPTNQPLHMSYMPATVQARH